MRLCATFIFALILALPPVAGVAADTQPTEYQLKAAYLYHFAQFVDWPPSAFAETNSPLIIGVLGENPFGNDLQHVVQGKVLKEHSELALVAMVRVCKEHKQHAISHTTTQQNTSTTHQRARRQQVWR